VVQNRILFLNKDNIMTLEYNLSYKSGKYTNSTLTYKPDDAFVKTFIAKESKNSFMCFSEKTNSTMSLAGHLHFSSDNQKLIFEQALKNKDLRKALEIAKELEPLVGKEMSLLSNPVSIFLTECLKEQEKVKEYNGRFFVAHGPFKKKQDPAHLVIAEAPALTI
jgi:hypothetical protein